MFFKQLEFIFYGFQDKRDQREPKGTNTQNLASLFEVQFVCTCSFYTPVFKTGRIMVYQCPTVCPSVVRFTCRALTYEPLGQFTSNFTELLELTVLQSVYFMVKFRIFIPELWDFFIHQIVGDFSYVVL